MRTSPSPSALLAGHLLGQDLESWVSERRDAGQSWDKVATDLYIATDQQVSISSEWLRRLYSGGADSVAWLPPVEVAQVVGITLEALQALEADGLIKSRPTSLGHPRFRLSAVRRALADSANGDAA